MMILKRKEIIAAALVVLIGMAGYLNWSYQDTISVKDGESYIEAGKKLGEAQSVSSTKETEEPKAEGEEENAAGAWGSSDGNQDQNSNQEEQAQQTDGDGNGQNGYFDAAKMEKQTSRAKSLEILNQTAANESFDQEIRKKAQEQILELAAVTESETAVENIAKAKGYHDICVFVNEGNATISVKKEGFAESDVVKLQEIACQQLKIPANNIKVVEVQ